jgi:hypothetical protein
MDTFIPKGRICMNWIYKVKLTRQWSYMNHGLAGFGCLAKSFT